MNLYQKLKVFLNVNRPGFQDTLIHIVDSAEGWYVRRDLHENFKKKAFLKDRSVISISCLDIQRNMQKYDIVNFLRGISIFTIVVMHLCQGYAGGALQKALSFGGAGVHVFILCSGFGLYLSYLRKPLGYGDFLKRRFLNGQAASVMSCILYIRWCLP